MRDRRSEPTGQPQRALAGEHRQREDLAERSSFDPIDGEFNGFGVRISVAPPPSRPCLRLDLGSSATPIGASINGLDEIRGSSDRHPRTVASSVQKLGR